jgi:hypothetical protein
MNKTKNIRNIKSMGLVLALATALLTGLIGLAGAAPFGMASSPPKVQQITSTSYSVTESMTGIAGRTVDLFVTSGTVTKTFTAVANSTGVATFILNGVASGTTTVSAMVPATPWGKSVAVSINGFSI